MKKSGECRRMELGHKCSNGPFAMEQWLWRE